MVINPATPTRPAGLVAAYNASLVGRGYCYVAAQRIDGGASATDDSRGLVAQGMFAFIQYLFDHFDFFKLYFEVPEYNLSLFGAGVDSLLVQEGLLAGHHWYGERRWDEYIFALYHEKWESVASLYRGEWPDGRR
ncbi:MAG: hypothetical protein H0X25_06730 [Acidobacteriales bacterium]|nr:hypothetical protein [Terriglobales bacterium]